MSPTASTEPTTQTLNVSGAILSYDVRRNAYSIAPPLLLIGSPMGAAGLPRFLGTSLIGRS